MKSPRKRIAAYGRQMILIAMYCLLIWSLCDTLKTATDVEYIGIEGFDATHQSAYYDEAESKHVYDFCNGSQSIRVEYSPDMQGNASTKVCFVPSDLHISVFRQPKGATFAATSGTDGVLPDGTVITVSKNDPFSHVLIHSPIHLRSECQYRGQQVTATAYFAISLDARACAKIAILLVLAICTAIRWAALFSFSRKPAQQCAVKPLT